MDFAIRVGIAYSSQTTSSILLVTRGTTILARRQEHKTLERKKKHIDIAHQRTNESRRRSKNEIVIRSRKRKFALRTKTVTRAQKNVKT